MDYSLETVEGVRALVRKLRYADESEEYERLMQKCIQKAQIFKDRQLEFEARLVYVHQVTNLNKKDKAIATFPWLLKEVDEGRVGYFGKSEVLWIYKWVITSLPGFVNVPLEKIEGLFDDMEKRYVDFGAGRKMIDYFKMNMYVDIGRHELARKHMAAYLDDQSKGSMDDCEACQEATLIACYIDLGAYQKAIDRFKYMMDAKLTCLEMPQREFPNVALAYWLLDKRDYVQKYAHLAVRKLRFDKAQLGQAGRLLLYYAFEKEFIKGRKILEKQWHFCFHNYSEWHKIHFYFGLHLLFLAMLAEGKRYFKLVTKEKLPLPKDILDKEKLWIEPAQEWVSAEIDQIARKFDARNGNDFYQKQKHYWLSVLQNGKQSLS